MLLMIYGGLHILGGLAITAEPVLDGHTGRDDQAAALVLGMVLVCWGGFIFLGGFMMKTLRS